MNAPTDPKLLANPLLDPWNTPYGLPPFDAVRAEHFAPAFEVALKTHRVELDAIATNAIAPTFDNTLAAFDKSGRLLASIELAPGSERELALQRAVVVRDALIAQGLPNERIFLGAPKLHAMGDSATPWSPSVQLSLGH